MVIYTQITWFDALRGSLHNFFNTAHRYTFVVVTETTFFGKVTIYNDKIIM